ncbi:hypothetical protein EVAR_94528_1 [Eumeta japonica]|uniref:Uncharacterized protein n=1 Tax=Eumeta variegata TaxID=151549 RepID=A0A4C1UVF3_EUMVA|nr:hypothetical protein EVAR_94528_1 [Eumeta japonica]
MRGPSKIRLYGSVKGDVSLAAGFLAAIDRTLMAVGRAAETEKPNINVALVQEPYIRNTGSEHDDAHGIDSCDFLDFEGLQVLNVGNTPKFEVYRGYRFLKGIVDVTACRTALDKAEGGQVVRDVIFSDHKAVAFSLWIERRRSPRPLSGTRVYNSIMTRWSEFETAMDVALSSDRRDGEISGLVRSTRRGCGDLHQV